MSHSRKRMPGGITFGSSQKRGKQFCNRKFRHKTRRLLHINPTSDLPLRTREVTNPWDLGADGKVFVGFDDDDEWIQQYMRK